jgi:gas vesicle protein
MKTGTFLTGLGLGMMAGGAAAMLLPERCRMRKKAKRVAHELEHSISHMMDCICS